jgi:glycosyltransferase involved in cell wall biosynthesis
MGDWQRSLEDLGLTNVNMKRKISIVVPAYNEEDCVDELAARLAEVFDSEPTYDFECVIVENGSIDSTMERLVEINKQDGRFRVLQLARNFRMDGGITAGLAVIDGDACVLMTADLQDPPELIPTFIREWEKGFENVYGVVTERQGTGAIRTFNSKAFYWLAGKLTNDRITKNASDFRLVDRKVYESVRSMEERNRFVRGLFSWVGFKSIGIPMVRVPRFAGVSNAHTLKVLDLAFKGIFAHSYVPLRAITLIGFAVSAVAVVSLLFFAVSFIFFGVPFNGYGTLVATLLIGFGIVALLLGVIGEYVGLIYEEVKRRPNFVISEKIGF